MQLREQFCGRGGRFAGRRSTFSRQAQGRFRLRRTPLFHATLQTTLVPEKAAAGTPTFTRADGADGRATFVDFEGRIVPVRAGEARFQGARRVYNLCSAATIASGAAQTLTLAAGTYVFSMGAGTGTATFSGTGGATGTLTANATYRTAVTKTITAGTFIITASVADLVLCMTELVTGQSNQNPSTYVAPDETTAGAQGVRYFDTLNGNTVASNVVTEATGARITSGTAKWFSLNGTSSNLSCPDSSARRVTNDLEIQAYGYNVDWTPSGSQLIIDKFTNPNRNFRLYLNSAGKLNLEVTSDGTTTAGLTATSSVATGFTDGTSHWVRVTRSASTGDVKFYTSDDGTTWTQLGTTQSTTAGAPYAGTSDINIGSVTGGGSLFFAGRFYRVKVLNDGVPILDCNANDYTSGSTFASSTTGETWTLNGSVKVFGSTDATYGIPAQWDSKGPFGYLSEGSRTNVLTYSADQSNAAWVGSGAVAVKNAVSPAGSTSASTLTASAGNGAHYIAQTYSPSAGAWTYSVFAKAGTASILQMTFGTQNAYANFNVSTGAAGGSSGVTSSAIEALPNGWYRCTVVYTNVNATSLVLAIASTSTDTRLQSWNAAGTETILLWQTDFVNASFQSTPIPTTSAAVTRAADSLTYTAAGNISGTVGTCCAEVTSAAPSATNNNNIISRSSGATSGVPLYQSNGTAQIYDGTNTAQSNVTLSATTPTKLASTWGGSALQTFVNGAGGTAGSFDGDMSLAASISVGVDGQSSGNSNLFGTIRNVRAYGNVLKPAEIVAAQA